MLRASVCTRVATAVVVSLALLFTGAPSAWAGDGSGFWWGTDSNGPVPNGSASNCPSTSVPWLEPNATNGGCGHYGGYMGEVGGYKDLLSGCPFTPAYNSDGVHEAKDNSSSGYGVGAWPYWFGGGPGADPNYDGTVSEAKAWGKKQAIQAISDADSHPNLNLNVMILDVEVDDSAFYGWNEVITPGTCNSRKSIGIDPSVDRGVLDGFETYIIQNTPDVAGIYSSTGNWSPIFGTSSSGNISSTFWLEVTAHWNANDCVNPAPQDWTQPAQTSGSCTHPSISATFFGGVGQSDGAAAAWQWNGKSSDYLQIKCARIDSSC